MKFFTTARQAFAKWRERTAVNAGGGPNARLQGRSGGRTRASPMMQHRQSSGIPPLRDSRPQEQPLDLGSGRVFYPPDRLLPLREGIIPQSEFEALFQPMSSLGRREGYAFSIGYTSGACIFTTSMSDCQTVAIATRAPGDLNYQLRLCHIPGGDLDAMTAKELCSDLKSECLVYLALGSYTSMKFNEHNFERLEEILVANGLPQGAQFRHVLTDSDTILPFTTPNEKPHVGSFALWNDATWGYIYIP